jgi:hypothetical protein
MKEEKEIDIKDYGSECVEAVPGPAIIITRQEYERIKNQKSSKENEERIKQAVKKLNIKKEEREL